MAGFRTALLALSLAVLPVTPVLALTAEQVWADLTRLARTAEVEVVATTRRQGDRLVVSDIRIPLGPPQNRIRLRLDRITLQDLPDGRVAVLLPAQFPLTIDASDRLLARGEARLTVTAPDFSLIVAGLGPTAAFDLRAPSLALTLTTITPPLEPGERAEVSLALADLVITQRMDLVSQAQQVALQTSLGALRGDLAFDDGGDERGTLALDLGGFSGDLSAVLPPAATRANPDPAAAAGNPLRQLLDLFADGMRLSGKAAVSDFAVTADLSGSATGGRVQASIQSGQIAAGLDPTAAFCDVVLGPVAITGRDLRDAELPNFAMTLDGGGYGVSFGIGDLVTPQDARVWARMTDLILPPEAWAEVDPAGVLGGVPLTFALEVTARYALMPGMLAPDWQPQPDVFPPMNIVEVTLQELLFAGAGIRITGGGALTFDETDLTTYAGLPAPRGGLSFAAEGVNTLIDRLTAAGMIPANDLTALRMGLMFIAKAGETADSLVSQVDFREDGLFLNGVKLR